MELWRLRGGAMNTWLVDRTSWTSQAPLHSELEMNMSTQRLIGIVLLAAGLVVMLLRFAGLHWNVLQLGETINSGFTQGYVGMIMVLLCSRRKQRTTDYGFAST